jgi:hypothetical protein
MQSPLVWLFDALRRGAETGELLVSVCSREKAESICREGGEGGGRGASLFISRARALSHAPS